MAFTQLDPWFPKLIGTSAVTIINGDGTALKTLFTASADGGKVNMLTSTSDDTATSDQQLWIVISGVSYLLGTKTIPITAGFVTGTPAFNWLDGIQIPGLPIDADGQRYIPMPGSGILKVGAKVAVTAAKTHYITAGGVTF